MKRSPSAPPRDAEREQQLAAALRAQWRLFEWVSVSRRSDGEGYEATIQLNSTLVRGAAEQQVFRPFPATVAKLEARRLDAIAACVKRVNDERSPADSIRGFTVIG